MDRSISYKPRPPKVPEKIKDMLERLTLAFTGPRTYHAPKDDRKAGVRAIVRAHSHGNIRLQLGQYYTKKDVDAKFNRLRTIDFTR